MLRLLDADERRVVFAHERAHLTRRHHLIVAKAAPAPRHRRLITPALLGAAFVAVATVVTGEFIALTRAWL
jgi:hypothetical protein